MVGTAPNEPLADSFAVAGVKNGIGVVSGAQEGARFRAFVQMRRAERHRLQEMQDAQRNKVRKQPTTALAVYNSAAAAPRPMPTRICEAKEKPGELSGYPVGWESMQRSALGSCIDPSGMVRSGCVPTLLRFAEDVESYGNRMMILQALEATAQENKRLVRFLELGGAVVLGRWLSDANKDLTLCKQAEILKCVDAQQKGHAETAVEFALLCLRVVGLLPLTAEEACTSGILEPCQKIYGVCPQAQQIVASLMVQWQLLPTAGEDDANIAQCPSPAAAAGAGAAAAEGAAAEQVHSVSEASVWIPMVNDDVDLPWGKESLDSHIDEIMDDIDKFEEKLLKTTSTAATEEDRCVLTTLPFRSKFQELAELLRPCMQAQDCKLPSSSVDKIQVLVRKLHGFMAGVDMSVAKGLAADLVVAMPLLQRVIASFTQACPGDASEETDIDTADKPIVSPAASQIHEVLPDVKSSTASRRWDCFIHSQTQSPIEL
mmetsp:Transcript_107021/g.212491  ORF Transcript_107021/g.212491 Transcript_107021/m.212491 type:complete len:488 (-) Transcript_107021:143-1606(-)